MKLALISIGNEVLSGRTIDTNANFLAKEFEKNGFVVGRQMVISDDCQEISTAFQEAFARCDLVIATGGLGPTLDDSTRKAAAEFFSSPFHLSEEVEKDLLERFGPRLETIEDQATIPKKAIPILNPLGTAPALVFDEGSKMLLLLPGVPHEMKALFEKALPRVREKFAPKENIFRRSINFFDLVEKDVDPTLRQLQENYRHVSFGIYPGLGLLFCTLEVTAANEREANKLLEPPLQVLLERFGKSAFQEAAIEEAVQTRFTKNGMTLSLAESCTGGAIASRLTSRAGSSRYFLGSFVTYSNEMKTEILGVSRELIEKHGAVSGQVAREMVLGAQRLSGSSHAAAVTGIAGPQGGDRDKPVGTIWFAICDKGNEPLVWQVEKKGTREMVIAFSVNHILAALVKHYG